MEKLKQETPDITLQNIDRIAELFPSAVTETKDANGNLKKAINFTTLKQLLSNEVVDGDECYEFTWVGKKQSIIEANRPIRKTLRPAKEESKNWETTENLYIEGDNLEVLKLLQNSYLNSIKMIYIDPPYNTGNDFVYRDNFSVSKDEYEEDMGVYDEDQNKLFKNTETNGRYHSDWCSMMYPRLQLARNLLTDDGVIFISIDDNEVAQLRKICDEVFGEINFITDVVWEKRFTRNNDAKLFSSVIDHTILYRKSDAISIIREPRTEKANSIYSNPDNDPRGPWTSVSYVSQRTKDQRPNLSYEMINPINRQIITHEINAWKYSKEQYELHLRENRLYWGKTGENTYPRLKRFLSELKDGMVPVNLWGFKEVGTLDDGTKDVDGLIGKDVFDYPKPITLIKKMLNVSGSKEKDIILDFFSGSATTAHAVMQLNAEDGGNRKFIMVQLPEMTDEKSEAYKAGYKSICEIGKERIRRAGQKIEEELKAKTKSGELFEEEVKSVDTGFRVMKLDTTNMKDVYYSAGEYNQQLLLDLESNIKDDRTDMDLLFGVMLEWGVPLSLPHSTENIHGKKVHFVNKTDLVACFEEEVSENVIREIAAKKPLRVVFRDSSFANTPDKINVSEIFKTLSPETTIKVI